MITYKTPEEIAILAEGGAILATILHELKDRIKPGVFTDDLNAYAIKRAESFGARPAFLHYQPEGAPGPYPAALCTSINDEVVHAMGTRHTELQNGDIISIDMGIEYKGLYTDSAMTIPVGSVSKEVSTLLNATKKSLWRGIEAIEPGGTISDIALAIHEFLRPYNYGVVRELVGHGVGYGVHEDPAVPNYVAPGPKIELKPGLVIAIEPMVNMGGWRVAFDDDGWTVRTKDGSLSAHFEHTVAVTETGYQVLTQKS